MDRRITPSFIEESSSAIEVLKIVLVRLAPPEFHIGNFKVTPEVACREALGLFIMLGSSGIINDPFNSVVFMEVVGMIGQELGCLGPQSRQGMRIVV